MATLRWLLAASLFQPVLSSVCQVPGRTHLAPSLMEPGSIYTEVRPAAHQSALGRKALLEATTSIPNVGPGLFQKMRFVFQQMVGFLGSTDLKVSQFLGRFMRRAPKEVPQECQAGRIGQKIWSTPEFK